LASPIEQLFALQDVDSRLQALNTQISDLEKVAGTVAEQASETRRRTEAQKQEIAEHDKRRREIETRLRDEEERIKNRRMRMQQIRNERELAAVKHEIDLSRESNSLLEEELLQLFETLETKNKVLETLSADLTKQEAELEERQLDVDAKREELGERLAATIAERNGLAAAIDQSDLDRYERLRARRAGVAVVPIRQGNCGGCGVTVPQRLLLEIHRNVDVVPCPSCNRLLHTSIARTPSPAPAE
jgi:uncharacterized protein